MKSTSTFLPAALILALLLTGCGKPRLDGSSAESLQRSAAKLRAALPPEQQPEFDAALTRLMVQPIDLATLLADKSGSVKPTESVLKALDGKTAAQILAASQALQANAAEAERVEFKLLQVKQARANAARAVLDGLVISSARYRKDDAEAVGRLGVIDLSVSNGTSYTVSYIYFMGTLTSSNRTKPWLRAEFMHHVPGGVAPGETVDWSLPQYIGPWMEVNAPADATLTVTAEEIDDMSEQTIVSARDFTAQDRQRLEELLSHFGTNDVPPPNPVSLPTTNSPSKPVS